VKGRRRIAVVGGGIAGITAAHVLQREHDVTLFEAGSSLGGHAHAIEVDDGRGGFVEVDTAFLIYNGRHYPRFCELLVDLGVNHRTSPAEMSASFADYDANLHYALARGLDSLFVQRRNLVRPAFYRMFAELMLFRRRAHSDMLAGRISESLTLGAYLEGYSRMFRDDLVVPLATAIWSLPGRLVLDYPARAILQFFMNHRLLHGESGDAWRTFDGASGVYVRAFRDRFRGRLELSTPVVRIERHTGANDAVTVVTKGARHPFDAVILATHADHSLALLDSPSPEESRVLSAFRYNTSRVLLHGDAAVLHRDRRLWASWNAVTRYGRTTVSYHLNRVQRLPASAPDYFLTLDDDGGRRHRTIAHFDYRHPIFDVRAVASQASLAGLQGKGATYFCGSYAGHGFHEDGVESALAVTRRFGLATIRARSIERRDGPPMAFTHGAA
jgi:uncharacterized protein